MIPSYMDGITTCLDGQLAAARKECREVSGSIPSRVLNQFL